MIQDEATIIVSHGNLRLTVPYLGAIDHDLAGTYALSEGHHGQSGCRPTLKLHVHHLQVIIQMRAPHSSKDIIQTMASF
ncbi:hypothetical protein DPMN_116999 [Dreissena polymorpha]|uniref:Uncharacterized protein n=1 Tax=Dreissena polymorpha TaxID=45954 RepID=A0A9D4QTW9_DREPO|nr:hypothetical protein DPMN_116999 [Dreissena polymorpha]